MNAMDRLQFFHILSKRAPNPQSELVYLNPYTLLIAVVLSAQTTDRSVNRATKSLFSKVKTPEEMVAFGEDQLKQYIQTIGLYNTKAKNVIKLSHMLIDFFNSKVPENITDLISLPGVGRKTAIVVLNIAFQKETFPDLMTHEFFVYATVRD